MKKPVKILAPLYKPRSKQGSDFLSGRLAGGRELLLYGDQRKRRRADHDGIIVVLIQREESNP